MIDLIAERIDELENDNCSVSKIVLEQAALEEVSEYVDEDDCLLGYDYVVDSVLAGEGFTVCFVDGETNIGVPTPSRVEAMVDNVDLTDAGNIVFGYLDLFANMERKYIDLDEEKMDEADVDYEGQREFDYSGEGTERLETVRFKGRVQDEMDNDRSFEDRATELREELVESVKRSVFRGTRVEDVKVNEPVPEEVDPEESDWVPNRVKVGEKVAVFDGVLLGNKDERRVETVKKENGGGEE